MDHSFSEISEMEIETTQINRPAHYYLLIRYEVCIFSGLIRDISLSHSANMVAIDRNNLHMKPYHFSLVCVPRF